MTILPNRLFRIMETHARIDAALRRAESRPEPDPLLIPHLRLLKLRATTLLRAAMERKAAATA